MGSPCSDREGLGKISTTEGVDFEFGSWCPLCPSAVNPESTITVFKKVLIANRGEIALRVVRACPRHGNPIGRGAFPLLTRTRSHVRFADEEGVHWARPLRARATNNVPALISAAEVDRPPTAVHPGYGFLGRKCPSFAEVVQKCGLHWIGAPARADAP